ncbi:Calcium-transporting ATPase 10, plasma membrane-type [Clydaea vesicula]|uniref:P-type Cu(+) transporter n=1 Tax=Clydaea vesicula TaxID=447962 RepID=A0AAD5U3E4_9FUNG|nr:Calcium-transporting ATPase 10, plasma membrane-type [Clydaea vesicula]
MSFGIDLNQLKEFLEPKNPKKLSEFGGVTKVCEALKSNLETGLSFNNADTNHTVVQTSTIVQDLEDKSLDEFKKVHPDDKNASFKERIDFYGTNTLPEPKSKSFLVFVWESLGDKTLIVLVIAAIVEIAIGIYKIIKTKETAGLFDGFAIVVAVLVVVIVTAGNDYRKQSQFRKLNDFSKGLASTKVIRNGQTTQIKNTELLIGDVAIIDTGDVIAADGIFIKGTDLKVDESSLTGESNAMLKDETKDPFLLSGTKVISGVGKMLIVGTGVNSVNGRILMTLNVETEETPLQKKLDGKEFPTDMYLKCCSIFISAVTLIVVAIPEGLPLAVTIALAHATLRMLKDNNLVRHLSACETMGNATTICSDKTGTLTMNQMTVVKGRIFNSEFDNQKRDVFQSSLLSTIPEDDKKQLLTLFGNCINVNSSADETENGEGKINFIGSKTDIALLNLTKLLGFSYKDDRKNANILEILPFSSEKKKMTTTVQYGAGDVCGTLKIPAKEQSEVLIFSKGASEIILSNCNKFVDEQGTLQDLTNAHKEKFVALIENYAKQALRTIAIGFKPLVNYDAKEEKGGEGQIVPEVSYSDPIGEEVPKAEVAKRDLSGEGLILLGIVGIEDPVRDAVPLAVKQCQNAGVVVRMVTGDNKVTARSIAQQCGILTEGGLVMEGPEFRNLSREEMDVVVLRLQVLARSSPLDKQILVNALKSK